MGRDAWWWPSAAIAIALTGSTALYADEPIDAEPTDWPATISRLQQQVYQAPNRGVARQQLAIAYNNYGVQLSEQGQWDLAVQQLREAIRLDAANTSFQQNLAQVRLQQASTAYQSQRQADALTALDEAIALNPKLADAYALRGRIEYNQQKLQEAKTAWERSLELNPSQPKIAEQLERLKQELPVESKFDRVSQAYFDLRYSEQLERPVGFDIRDTLFEARRLIGSAFGYWPDHKIVVLVYGADTFRKLRQETPEWVSGQFDGKIRVPLPSAQLDQATVRGILFHEYTHALIYDLGGGRCPLWMNEGLAEYEGRTQAPRPLLLLKKAHDRQALVPWLELSEHISMSLPAEEVGLAYEQSYSMVTYLAERYGFWRFRRLLKAFAEGVEWPAAMEAEYRMKLSRLEARWLEWLPGQLAAPSH